MRKARKLDVSCPNADCLAFNKLGLRNIIRFGKQPNQTQRYRCTDCWRTFARTLGTPFFHKHMKKREIVQMCKLFAEKNSLRSVARVTGHHLDTVRGIADAVSMHAKQYNEYFVKELGLSTIEVDEIWSYLKKKKTSALRRTAKAGRSATPTLT
jgi:transposase-like protein